MKKENIETLIKLTQNEIDEFNFDLDMNIVNLNRLKEVAPDQVISRYEKSIIKLKSGLVNLNSCLSDLNKLKEFELPTQEEIDRHFQLYGGITVNTNNKIEGANWMLDIIKNQL